MSTTPDVVPVAWRFAIDGTVFTGPTRAACCRVIGDISIDGEIEPLYSQAALDALQARIDELEAQLFIERSDAVSDCVDAEPLPLYEVTELPPLFETLGLPALPAFPSIRTNQN